MIARSASIGKLAAALAKAQGAMKPAGKGTKNPFFGSMYADLAAVWDACREPLAANELAISQPFTVDGIAVTVTTLLMHSSGEWMESAATAEARDAGPQAVGSCVTYLKRYSLSAVCGIATEDDDGNAGQGKEERKETPADRATKAKAEKKQSGSTLIPGALNTADSAVVASILKSLSLAKSLEELDLVVESVIKPKPEHIRNAVRAAYAKRERELDDLSGDLGSQVGADEAAAIRQREAEEARTNG